MQNQGRNNYFKFFRKRNYIYHYSRARSERSFELSSNRRLGISSGVSHEAIPHLFFVSVDPAKREPCCSVFFFFLILGMKSNFTLFWVFVGLFAWIWLEDLHSYEPQNKFNPELVLIRFVPQFQIWSIFFVQLNWRGGIVRIAVIWWLFTER